MGHHRAPAEKRPNRRMAWAAGATAVGLGMAITGAFAGWGESHNLTTGSLSAANVSSAFADSGTNVWQTDVDKLVAGDYFYRYGDLSNTGNVSQAFTAVVSGTGDLTAAGGLQAAVHECTSGWVPATETDDPACETWSSVVTNDDVAANGSGLLGTIAPAAVKHLRVTITLPENAPTSLYEKTGTVTVTTNGAAASGDRTAS